MLSSTFLSLVLLSASPDWRTPAEVSGYRETPRYEQTRAYFERLDSVSEQAKVIEFGISPEGRSQFVFVIASNGEFTPDAAKASNKPVLLFQACIHAGENEGKDALMALARDWLVNKRRAPPIDNVIVLMMPIFNVDGHERFAPHHRINQNGPNAMGWRTTAQNLNLNRDFVKAEAPEMRAWLKLWQAWNPALLVDMHNTNGADYQYDLLYHMEPTPIVHPAIDQWSKAWLQAAIGDTEKSGFLMAPYFDMKKPDDIQAGVTANLSPPRYSAGFGPARNRPALLLETHMLKDFKTRVLGNVAFVQAAIAAINRNPSALVQATEKADQDAAARKAGDSLVLDAELSEQSKPWLFKGYETSKTLSEISGAVWTRYDTKKPISFQVDFFDTAKASLQVALPAAYLVPRSWQAAITKLKLHGVVLQTLDHAIELPNAATYRFEKVTYAPQPFESRVRITSFDIKSVTEQLSFPAGSALVRVDQAASTIAAHLLEPAAPDSLVRIGLADWMMTRSEYAEPRVLEAKARAMLAADPALRAEFEARLVNDPAFAGSASARLDFFYRRLPHYDERYLRYPVAKLTQAQLEQILQTQKKD